MKVKELIEELKKQDQDAVVYTQQGGQHHYMESQTIRTSDIYDENDNTVTNAVIIQYW
jgi:hypothetical protein